MSLSFYFPNITETSNDEQGLLHSRQGVSNVRSYWWSKPATSEAANATGPSHVSEPVAQVKSAAVATPSDQIKIDAVDVTASDVPVPESGISEAITSALPPLQYGDFAALGITGWSPAGIIAWSFELLQVSTAMPWFYTVIAGTLFWRGILIPSALTSIRNTARLSPYAEQMKTLDEQAQAVKDRAAKMEIMLKKQKLIENAGVSVRSMILPPIIQVAGNLGLFFAMRRMVELPVMQMTQSGVWLLPDLTLTGGYVMPALVLLAMNVQFSVMKKELDATKLTMAHTLNVFRVASFATLPMMSWMPTGLWLSVVTGILLSVTQSTLLRVPRIRQALGIPPAVASRPPVTMRDTGRMMLEWYRQRKMEAVASHAVNERKPNWTTLPKASRRAR